MFLLQIRLQLFWSLFWLLLIEDAGSLSQTSLLCSQLLGLRSVQRVGLINHQDTCCHLSLVLCFHRMGLLRYLREDLIAAGANVFDWPALVLMKMLRAMPSLIAFPVQIWLAAWNRDARQPTLQSNDDLPIVDGILSQLPLNAGQNNIPVLTRCNVSFACVYCGLVNQSREQWNEKSFVSVPTLHVAAGRPPTSAEDLMDEMLNQHMRITCPNRQCGRQIAATWRTVMGIITVVYIDRFDLRGRIINTRLVPRPQGSPPHALLGDLVSVISRSGGNYDGGPFVSYHQVGGRWYFSNDDHSHYPCNFHPFERRDGNETVSLLCYRNI